MYPPPLCSWSLCHHLNTHCQHWAHLFWVDGLILHVTVVQALSYVQASILFTNEKRSRKNPCPPLLLVLSMPWKATCSCGPHSQRTCGSITAVKVSLWFHVSTVSWALHTGFTCDQWPYYVINSSTICQRGRLLICTVLCIVCVPWQWLAIGQYCSGGQVVSTSAIYSKHFFFHCVL